VRERKRGREMEEITEDRENCTLWSFITNFKSLLLFILIEGE
jgi:hypothetical protein